MTKATVDAGEYRRAIGQFATGVAVITCFDKGERPVGITVNSLTSVSLNPPTLLWCLGDDAVNKDALAGCAHFAVNILAESQAVISNHFADPNRAEWGDLPWESIGACVPVLPQASAHLICLSGTSTRVGDHQIILGHVTNCRTNAEVNPLLYFNGSYRRIGSTI